MISLNLDPQTRRVFDRDKNIRNLEGYFHFGNQSPKEVLLLKPSLANKAIGLLNKIQEITGSEYVFLHIQGGPSGGSYCVPRPKDYKPSEAVHSVLGCYDRAYFQKFLEG
ncbi:MAG: hypothetical protein Q8R18_05460 [bacterium]|nr:hypothetical protein [bacterium]